MNFAENEIPEMAKVVERNVNALLHHKKEEIRKRNFQEKFVDAVTAFASSMASLYAHLFLFGSWILWNCGWLNVKTFDPNFTFLVIFAALETIFLTTFVLIGQKRMKIQADKWAELDLQISLLTEHEVTKIMKLVTAIAKKMEIEEADNKEIEELSKDIHPEKVLDTIEKAAQ